MTQTELKHIILQGENEKVEFKQTFNKEVVETIVAFSNHKGGNVLIGVNNKGEIKGGTITEEMVQKWINEVKQNTSPQVIPSAELIPVRDKIIVVLHAIEYPVKPVSFKTKYYKRVLNSNHLMNLDEISNLHLRTINSSWDFYLDDNHTIDSISIEKVEKYISLYEKIKDTSVDYPALEFLNKLEILRNNKLTYGAYLLFAKEYCPISDIQIGRFKSDITIIDTLSLNADLFSELDQILIFIKKHLKIELVITGNPQHEERYDYPLAAIREIVINMLVHRDYRSSNGSSIKIYDNRIEFNNPGGLFGGLTLKDLLGFNYISQTRNKLIALAFKEVGIIEKYGSGIKRIFTICKNHGVIPPKVLVSESQFQLVLFNEKLNEGVNEGVNRLYELIKLHPNNRTPFYAEKLPASVKNIERWIKELKTDNKIAYKGSAKKGGYFIIVK